MFEVSSEEIEENMSKRRRKESSSRFQRCASIFLTFETVSYFLFVMLATRFSVHRW